MSVGEVKCFIIFGLVEDFPQWNACFFGLTEYGYGITVDDREGIVQWGQTGFAPGFVSMNFYFPKSKTSVIVLENVNYDLSDLKKTFYYHSEILNIVRDLVLDNKNNNASR